MSVTFGSSITPIQGSEHCGMLLHRASPCVIGSNLFGAGILVIVEIIALKGLNLIAMGVVE